MSEPAGGLDEASDEDLALLWGRPETDEPTQARIMAIIAARDKADRAERSRQRRHKQDTDWYAGVKAEWEVASHDNFLRAEAECNGVLLNRCAGGQCPSGYNAEDKCRRHGVPHIRDPYPTLWIGSEKTARRRASEELCGFWDNPRTRRTPMVSVMAEADKLSTNRERIINAL